ncbi:MAG: LD-carboxypeptidase [Alphaproteobacteria bacterium]|nr:LD-carboxypeptidase [Alphaproteobacteria bacterium]
MVAPARWLAEDPLRAAATTLFGDRFRLVWSPQLARRHHQFAGTDAERAAAINEMFADPQISAIICAKGGYGAPRIVDALDYALIARHPKRFVGYSDITTLLLGIARHAGLETYHGPMLVDVAEGLAPDSIAHLLATLSDTPAPAAAAALLSQAAVARPGRAAGPLIGGNLSLLVNMIGTPTDFSAEGAILFLEDVDEPLYHLDRMIVHLRRAQKLAGVAGVIVGEMIKLRDSSVPFGATVEDMVLAAIGDAQIPVVTNFPCGHGPRQMTLPIGAPARLACDAGTVTFEVG